MTAPAAHEPAFIASSELSIDETCSGLGASKPCLNHSPDSRSTSTGSLSPSLSPLPSMSEGEVQCLGLPDYEYPVPFYVRNTFIEAGIGRPLSLDEFFEERRVHSCPVASPPGLSNNEVATPVHSGLEGHQAPGMVESVWAAAMAASAAAAAAAAATRCWMQPLAPYGHADAVSSSVPNDALQSSPAPVAQAPVLRLADALVEPELGSEELPTVGSAGHRTGNCKPCAFYYTKGCGNSINCTFCHLCPAGEKKRRQKEKGAFHREMRRMGFVTEA